jgi:membrane protease subunit (stomatin/prohibitin family)
MATRTAVVAGTATAVSGRVARRQDAKYAEQDAQQYAAQQAAAPPPAPAEDDATAQLQNLANLHAQGVLTDEEFAASKAKILGI